MTLRNKFPATRERLPLLGLALILNIALPPEAHAGRPDQFRAWGTIAPDLKPMPSGWHLLPADEGNPLPSDLSPTAEELARGFVVFGRDPFVLVDVGTVPVSAERLSELRCFATPGESESLAVGIHALEDLSRLKTEVSDLRSPEGNSISAEELDLRVTRELPVLLDPETRTWRMEPFLLEKRAASDLPKSHSSVLWITLHVPTAAPAGVYSGVLSIQRPAHPAAQVRIFARVLPFTLPPAPVETTMYYPRPAESDEMLARELLDIREHGCSVPIPAMEVRVKTRDQVFGPDDADETIACSQRLLRACAKVFGPWRFPLTFEAGHQIAYYWDPARNWFAYWPHSPQIERDFAHAIELIRAIAISNGAPALRIYVSDEGGAHNLLDEAVYYNRWVKDRFPEIVTTASVGGGIALGFDEIGQLGRVVDLLTINRFTPELARALVDRQKPYGVYNGAGDTPAGARFFFGFYGFKTGAAQIGQWAYSFGESPFTDKGLRQPDEGYIYHAPDGPVPTIRWEAVRAGISDLRYASLLSDSIAAAKGSQDRNQRLAGQRAERVVNALLEKIGWGFQAMQTADRTPPPHPSVLRKWRWQVAQQILALQAAGVEIGTAHPSKRSSPFEFAWAQALPNRDMLGSELLPASNFAAGLKPWRVEAWSGHGRGELDSAEPHQGSPSLRIDSPQNDGNSAVTVLVWPKYGDNKIALNLAAERAYELSAWVKVRHRATPPELRINLPPEALKSARTGRDPAAQDGWQRLWTRAELSAAATPNYLAVWLQGPGTLWLNHLSFREVIPPALTVSLDQEEYDSLDPVGCATAQLAKQITPARIRCVLRRPTGDTLAVANVPAQPSTPVSSSPRLLTCRGEMGGRTCQFLFYPARLRPGDYIIRLELLNEAGARLAQEEAAFKRLDD